MRRRTPVILMALLFVGCVEKYSYQHVADVPGTTPGDSVGRDASVDASDVIQPLDVDGEAAVPDTREPTCEVLCDGLDCGVVGLHNQCDCGDCDDDNPCTDDYCADWNCIYDPLDEPCDDDDSCTIGDQCQGGNCVGTQKDCDDGNPCTDDACGDDGDCVNVDNSAACDDDDPCTEPDVCSGGVCVGPPKDCGDGNPCTKDFCGGSGVCDHDPVAMNGSPCDDGNPCTDDACSGGVCAGTLKPPEDLKDLGCVCAQDADCEEIEDGDVCNGTLVCIKEQPEDPEGICEVDAATVLTCDDGIECTENLCDPEAGCLYNPDSLLCDDEDPCTDDTCDTEIGCTYVDNTASCDDGNACTEGDICADGVCAGLTEKDCDDENPCTDDICDTETGCTDVDNTASCDDGNACTEGDICADGVCAGLTEKDCDDENPCTDDTCDETLGCESTPIEDGTPCGGDDICFEGSCCTPDCTDKECGDDGCGGSCGLCYGGEKCQDGACMPVGMVWVDPGACWRGCKPDDNECGPDEDPYHEVTLSGFAVDETEVPMADYQVCVGAGGCVAAGGGDCDPSSGQKPANCVTWDQSAAYCAWAGKRLCTEAEWEKAARGTDGRMYPWGDTPAWDNDYMCDDYAVAYGCAGGLRDVGAREMGASPYGAEDMLGNVWEWTADWYKGDYYCNGPDAVCDASCAGCAFEGPYADPWTDPPGPTSATHRVLRGNAYTHTFVPGAGALNMRLSRRLAWSPDEVHEGIGIRCCWSP